MISCSARNRTICLRPGQYGGLAGVSLLVAEPYIYVLPSPGLGRTRFGEALDRFDLCVVLGDALGCQMWIVEARSHDDSDTLDCSGFYVVDAARIRTTIAGQPDDRWRNSLNRHGGFPIC